MGTTRAARTPFAARPIARASRAHASAVETASAKRDDAQAEADAAPFSLM
jgi:hypothetical protein